MKRIAKLTAIILALGVAVCAQTVFAFADEETYTAETVYTFDNPAKEVFGYENPFDYIKIKKTVGEDVTEYSKPEEVKDYIEKVTVDKVAETDYAYEEGKIVYKFLSETEVCKVTIDFVDRYNIADLDVYVKVYSKAPEGTLSYDLTALHDVRTAVSETEISGKTFTIPKEEMRKLVKSEVYPYSDLYVELFVIKPKQSRPSSATGTKKDGTYPTISLTDSGEYRFYILYGDKEYEKDDRFMMTTEGLTYKQDGWYDGENLVIPIFSFNYENEDECSVTASGGGEDGVVNRTYSDVNFTITDGALAKDGLSLEYSANSTDGTNGDWAEATSADADFDLSSFTTSSISFTPKKTGYFRVKCVAQSSKSDEFVEEYAVIRVSKEYTEVKLIDMRFRDFLKNNWKSLIFLGLAVLSLAGIVVVALYKPKDGGAGNAVVEEDGETEATAEEATEFEDDGETEEATDEVEETSDTAEEAENSEETAEVTEDATEETAEEATQEAKEPEEKKPEGEE